VRALKALKAMRRFLSRLSVSAARRHDDARLREELETHLQMQTVENIHAGMSPEEARRRAILKFGPIEAIKDSYRDEQRVRVVDDVLQDVRYTFRQLRKAPLFTLTATVSLAMGIGANAAVFTVVERVLLRTLPVSNPHELVYVTDERILTRPSPRFSYPFYAVLRENVVLNGVAARAAIPLNVTVNGQTVRAGGELVSGNYFGVLGANTEAGRPLSPDDDRTPGAHPVAVISEPFWQRTFASDPAVVGRSVLLNGQAFTIVGVAANGFTGTDIGLPADIWIPLAMQREVGRNLLTEARTNWLEMVGRLHSGQGREQAAEALNRHFQQRASELPPQASVRLLVLTPGDKGSTPVRGEQRSALMVLFALTGLALALACVNVACLAAVRSAGREKEIAIRLAIGAARPRLERQLLTEGLVLAALGGVAAVLIAPWTARALIAAQTIALRIEPGLDLGVLLFGLFVSMLTGFVVALVPILASRKVRLVQGSEGSCTNFGAASRRLTAHDAIVAFQIAMALSMLISAALLVQSLRSLNSVDPGFRADNLLLASLDPRAAAYDSNRIDGFWRATLEQVKLIPGVQSVSLAGTVPMAPGRQRQPWVNATSGEKIEIDTNFVGPRYFQTLGIPLQSGREFNEDDGRASRPVVMVNERLAQIFWPQQDPIGKGVRVPESGNPLAEVVGVVRDVKYRDLRGEAGPMIYRPVLQTRSTDSMTLHVRASSDPGALVNGIRLAIQNIDRNVPLFQITTLEEQLDSSFAQTRQAALLTSTFGVLALLLSGIGVYGVTALAVNRRTRDIGIRMALGAQRVHIVRAVGARGIALIAIGLFLGVLGSFGFTRMTGTLMFGVTGGDPATYAGMASLLALVSVLAFSIPVRAATRQDALAAIRHE
jgi:macrolide transport system ATP-binding/permease protein